MKPRLLFLAYLIIALLALFGCSDSKSTTNTPNTPSSQVQQVQPSQPEQSAEKPVATQIQTDSKQQPETKANTSAQPTTTAPAINNTPPPKVQKKEVIVYITRTGHKYHLDGCRYLARSQIPISLTDAKAQGYGPCSVCGPPR